MPVQDRPEYRAMGDGTTADRVAAGARWLAGSHERPATIQPVSSIRPPSPIGQYRGADPS